MTTSSSITRRVALAVAFALAACNWGTRPERFPPAMSAEGARVAVRLTGEREDRVGELFAVDSTGVTIHARTLLHVSWTRLRAMDVDRLDSRYDLFPGEQVTPTQRARLALVSRFPQGLSVELLRRVLAQLGQAELERIE